MMDACSWQFFLIELCSMSLKCIQLSLCLLSKRKKAWSCKCELLDSTIGQRCVCTLTLVLLCPRALTHGLCTIVPLTWDKHGQKWHRSKLHNWLCTKHPIGLIRADIHFVLRVYWVNCYCYFKKRSKMWTCLGWLLQLSLLMIYYYIQLYQRNT